MPDIKTKKRPENTGRINLLEKWEIDYWTQELNTSERTLREAINKVGNSAEEVRRYLMSR